MTLDINVAFKCECVFEVLEGLPGVPERYHYFFPPDSRGGQEGLILKVQPETGKTWIGQFAFGKFDRSGISCILSMPDPGSLCVVARGAGYVVSVANPVTWELIRAFPIVDSRVVSVAGLVVFANYTELVAYGEEGMRWRTKRLAWDGFKITGITERTLVGEYSDLGHETIQQFEVDLLTGTARGGVER